MSVSESMSMRNSIMCKELRVTFCEKAHVFVNRPLILSLLLRFCSCLCCLDLRHNATLMIVEGRALHCS